MFSMQECKKTKKLMSTNN